MAVQKGSIRLGIASETTEGTAVSAPQYLFGLEDGGVTVAPSQEPDDLTSGERSSSSVHRGDAECGAEFTCRANLASIGKLLWGALGDKSVTGTGPYTHTFKLADTLQSFTVFESVVDGAGIDVPRVAGAKIDSLVFAWEGNGPLRVTAGFKGRALSFGASDTASVLDETSLTTNFIPAGGTFKLDVDSATPATALLKGGSITITNNLEAQFYSGTITAGAVDPGWHVAECAFTVVPADIDEWRTIITGTSSGSGVAASPVYGSFEHAFKSQGGVTAHQLTLAASRVAYMCDLPQAEAGGGAAEVELAGRILNDGTDGTIVATLVNATASY
jgi:hypothetical protein